MTTHDPKSASSSGVAAPGSAPQRIGRSADEAMGSATDYANEVASGIGETPEYHSGLNSSDDPNGVINTASHFGMGAGETPHPPTDCNFMRWTRKQEQPCAELHPNDQTQWCGRCLLNAQAAVVPPPVSHPPAENWRRHATELIESYSTMKPSEKVAKGSVVALCVGLLEKALVDVAALQQQIAALTVKLADAQRTEGQAVADVLRMAMLKVGEKCEHHKLSLDQLEYLALRECPICWKAAAEQAEQQVAALQREQERLLRELGTMGNATDNRTAPTTGE